MMMMMMKAGMTPETRLKIERLKKLMADGMGKMEAVATVGLSKDTVNRWAQELGVPLRKYNKKNGPAIRSPELRPMMTSVEVPAAQTGSGKVLLIYGSAAECAEIARRLV